MPKATRRRSAGHEQSVKLPKRKFAVQDNAVEQVDIGANAQASADEILSSMTDEAESGKPIMKKKEKQAMKHELFLQRLESTRSPYSKSHERRLKRKAREQVAGGLDDMQAAISAVAGEIPVVVVESVEKTGDEASEDRSNIPRPRPGQIGEGKSAPLSKSQRKRALQAERLRVPMILSNPEFASNPFQTIRTHAQNTLVKHKVPE